MTTPAPGRTLERPQAWVGAQTDDIDLWITWTDGEQTPKRVSKQRTAPPSDEGEAVALSDIAYDRTVQALVALCCEPVAGTIWRTRLSGGEDFEQYNQGTEVDMLSDEEAVARADGAGNALVQVADTPRTLETIDNDARDIRISNADGVLRFALIADRDHFREVRNPDAPDREREVVVGVLNDGDWKLDRYPIPDGPEYCAIAYVTSDEVGLVPIEGERAQFFPCPTTRIDTLDVETMKIERSTLTFDTPVRHVSTDDTSSFLIYTTVSGSVRWRSLSSNDSGELAASGFIAADW